MQRVSSDVSTENEKRLADEKMALAMKLQRKQRLEAMIEKRKHNFNYLKKTHEGKCYWVNCVRMNEDDIKSHVASTIPEHRGLSFYYLGSSMSNLLSLPAGPGVVRAAAQLLEEWEYYFSSLAMQGVKYVMARNSQFLYPQLSSMEYTVDNVKPMVYKFNNDVVYEHLVITHVPFELDYVEVFVNLCDTLHDLYDKLMHDECFSNVILYEAIVRLDVRIKHFVINVVAKEFQETTCTDSKNEIDLLRASLYS